MRQQLSNQVLGAMKKIHTFFWQSNIFRKVVLEKVSTTSKRNLLKSWKMCGSLPVPRILSNGLDFEGMWSTCVLFHYLKTFECILEIRITTCRGVKSQNRPKGAQNKTMKFKIKLRKLPAELLGVSGLALIVWLVYLSYD